MINFQLKCSHLFSMLGQLAQGEIYFTLNHIKKSPTLYDEILCPLGPGVFYLEL